MPRPNKTDFTNASVTEGGFKTAMDGLVDWLDLLLGSVDDYIRMVRGTTAARPSATEGGWLRWNTDNTELEMSWGTSWNQVVRSSIDATWKWNLESTTNINGLRVKGTGASQKVRVEDNTTSVDLQTSSANSNISSSGTRPFRILINGTPVFNIDSSGNLTVIGDVIANGTIV